MMKNVSPEAPRWLSKQNTDRVGHGRETSPKVRALDLSSVVQRDVLHGVLARVPDGVHHRGCRTRDGPEVVSEGEDRPVG